MEKFPEYTKAIESFLPTKMQGVLKFYDTQEMNNMRNRIIDLMNGQNTPIDYCEEYKNYETLFFDTYKTIEAQLNFIVIRASIYLSVRDIIRFEREMDAAIDYSYEGYFNNIIPGIDNDLKEIKSDGMA